MAQNSSNAPVASNLVFLYQLNDQPPNTKVRFLCCVVDYNEQNGCLTVEHRYPRVVTGPACISAVVDLGLVLETTRCSLLQTGSWVNVVGYVQSVATVKRRISSAKANRQSNVETSLPKVQAVLIWDAGAVQLDKYEETIKQYLAVTGKK